MLIRRNKLVLGIGSMAALVAAACSAPAFKRTPSSTGVGTYGPYVDPVEGESPVTYRQYECALFDGYEQKVASKILETDVFPDNPPYHGCLEWCNRTVEDTFL